LNGGTGVVGDRCGWSDLWRRRNNGRAVHFWISEVSVVCRRPIWKPVNLLNMCVSAC